MIYVNDFRMNWLVLHMRNRWLRNNRPTDLDPVARLDLPVRGAADRAAEPLTAAAEQLQAAGETADRLDSPEQDPRRHGSPKRAVRGSVGKLSFPPPPSICTQGARLQQAMLDKAETETEMPAGSTRRDQSAIAYSLASDGRDEASVRHGKRQRFRCFRCSDRTDCVMQS